MMAPFAVTNDNARENMKYFAGRPVQAIQTLMGTTTIAEGVVGYLRFAGMPTRRAVVPNKRVSWLRQSDAR